MNTNKIYTFQKAAVFALVCGVLVAISSWAGVSFISIPARFFSSDGALSPAFSGMLLQSQFFMGVCLTITGVAFLGLSQQRFLSRMASLYENDKIFIGFIAVLAFGMSAFCQWIVFDNIPHVTDAISHMFESKILAQGMIQAPLPPCHEFFMQINIFMSRSGLWFSPYPPGHAITLLPFTLSGTLFIFGPLLSTVSCLTFRSILVSYVDKTTVRIASVLFALSPLAALLGGSFMSHTTFLFYALQAVWMTKKAWHHLLLGEKRMTPLAGMYGFLAGLAFGMTLLTRPQDAFLLGLSLLAGICITGRTHIIDLFKIVPVAVAGLLIPLAIQLMWNHQLYGHVLAVGYGRTKIDVLNPVLVSRLGFHSGFTIHDALQQFIWTLARFDKALFGWTGGILFLLPALFLGRHPRVYWASFVSICLVLGFYFLCDYYAFEYEARYFSPAIPCAALLAAGTISGLIAVFPRLDPFLRIFVIACTLHTFLYYWPQYLWPRYSGDYEQATTAFRDQVRKEQLKNSLILIKTDGEEKFRYSSGIIWNDPRLKNDILYARDLPGGDDCLKQHFPDRAIYTADYNVDTKRVTLTKRSPEQQ